MGSYQTNRIFGTEKVKGTESRIIKNVPNLGRELDIQIQGCNRGHHYLNAKKKIPKHVIIKLSKIKVN